MAHELLNAAVMRSCLLFVSVFFMGCDPGNTHDACVDISHNWCHRLFDLSNQGCTSASAFLTAHSIVSENDCENAFSLHGSSCTNTGVNACAPEDYSGSRATHCSSDVSQFTCDFDFDAGPTSPNCDHICCLGSGMEGQGLDCCSGKSHLVQTGGCLSNSEVSICD